MWWGEAGSRSRGPSGSIQHWRLVGSGLCLMWGCVPVSVWGTGRPHRLSLQRVAGFLVLLLGNSQGTKSLLSKDRYLKKVEGFVVVLFDQTALLSLLCIELCVQVSKECSFSDYTLHLILEKEPNCVAWSPSCPPCSPAAHALCARSRPLWRAG